MCKLYFERNNWEAEEFGKLTKKPTLLPARWQNEQMGSLCPGANWRISNRKYYIPMNMTTDQECGSIGIPSRLRCWSLLRILHRLANMVHRSASQQSLSRATIWAFGSHWSAPLPLINSPLIFAKTLDQSFESNNKLDALIVNLNLDFSIDIHRQLFFDLPHP